jgi:hypothetical protein
MACAYAAQLAEPLVIILSDKQAAIQATVNPLITSRTVSNTIWALNNLANQGIEVCLQWIRGHNGTDGNELADHMANQGATSEVQGPEPFLPFSLTHAKMAEKEALLDKWTACWTALKQCPQTKLFMPKPDISLSKNLFPQPKKKLGLLLQHIIGFSFFAYHQSIIDKNILPECRLCGFAREESGHIINKN